MASKFDKKKKEMAKKVKSNESGAKASTRFEPEMDGGEYDKKEKKYKLPSGGEKHKKCKDCGGRLSDVGKCNNCSR